MGSTLIPGDPQAQPLKKPLRVAHLTDIHVKPDPVAEKGMALALRKAQSTKEKVDFIINGGDAIMDALGVNQPAAREQFDLFKKILNEENRLPVYHCIGNHDIWGWFIKENRPEQDPLYGKAWVVKEFSMPDRFYSFSKANWTFIILDSTQLNPAGGYIARLDPEQMKWLEQELEKVSPQQHVCIVSHIPIFSICAGLFFEKTEANGDLKIQRNLMHTDFFTLKKLFRKYKNIRACISGHIHLQDEIEYLGVKYYCNGAVSGSWWKGSFQEFAPAFAIMEFYDNGDTKRTMIEY